MAHTAASSPRTPTLRRAFGWSVGGFIGLVAATITACGGGSGAGAASPPPVNTGPARATLLGVSLSSPWGMAFLPDGRMLVTQKAGSMVIVRADGSAVDATVTGLPTVNSSGQGGLLDVADRKSVV